MRRYRAALLGYYGFGNLGDELLLQSCLELLGRDGVVVLSNAPDDTSRAFGVSAVNRWSFREVVRALRNSRALVLGGGGLFQDTTSVMSCVWYWGVVRLAKLLGCKVYALGQSVGPLKSGVSRVLAGNALRACSRVHVRDDASLRLAESLGCREVISGGDMVMTLNAWAFGGGRVGGMNAVHAKGVRTKLLNLRPSAELDRYTKILAPHIDTDTIGVALSDDDVEALASLKLPRTVRVKTFSEARDLWANAACAVGMRLHFGVLSRIFRTPLALMPYDVKVSEFAGQSGVPCIHDEWVEPVMPRDVVACGAEDICREIISL